MRQSPGIGPGAECRSVALQALNGYAGADDRVPGARSAIENRNVTNAGNACVIGPTRRCRPVRVAGRGPRIRRPAANPKATSRSTSPQSLSSSDPMSVFVDDKYGIMYGRSTVRTLILET